MSMIHRAGDVVGTPDWQLDRMYETETAEALERAYADDDFPFSSIESEFSTARYFIGQAVVHLARAANYAEPYCKDGPIDELIDRLDDQFEWDMNRTLEGLKK